MKACEGCGIEFNATAPATYIVLRKGRVRENIAIGKHTRVELDFEDEPIGVIFQAAPDEIDYNMLQEVADFRLTSRYASYIEDGITQINAKHLCETCIHEETEGVCDDGA